MTFEPKPDSGSLFKSDNKQTETDRDYSGSALIGGKEYWLSGYVNETKDGRKYLGLRFKPKEAKPQPTTSKMQPRSMKDELDEGDEIPF
jgi:hypothetical protein